MQNKLRTSSLCILLLTLMFSSPVASSGRGFVQQLGAAPKNLDRVIDTSLAVVIPGVPHSIAMTSSRDGNNEVYVMDANGDGQTRVATHPSNDQRPDISPDGTQIVFSSNRDGNFEIFIMDSDGNHAAAENGLQSLRVRQVNTNSDKEVVAPSDVRYQKLIFSPDGDFIYYVATDRNSVASNLYSIDVLGGSARKLISNVTSAVTLSPDGQSVAFIRNMADVGEDVVIIADATGSNERKIAARKLPNFFSSLTCARL